jgi:hypothetical protein
VVRYEVVRHHSTSYTTITILILKRGLPCFSIRVCKRRNSCEGSQICRQVRWRNQTGANLNGKQSCITSQVRRQKI